MILVKAMRNTTRNCISESQKTGNLDIIKLFLTLYLN